MMSYKEAQKTGDVSESNAKFLPRVALDFTCELISDLLLQVFISQAKFLTLLVVVNFVNSRTCSDSYHGVASSWSGNEFSKDPRISFSVCKNL